MIYQIIKRTLDLFLIISFFPLIIVFSLLISISLFFEIGYPILFFQKRIGLSGREFKIIKFRTMTNEKDKLGELLPDFKRITRIGKLIRKSSLDELPSLINVLIGNMSIVGPRPFIVKYKNLYSKEQNQRHDVKPGITGLAQINGRNNLSWEDKFEWDITYVKNQSFILDIKILLKTFVIVLRKEGVNQNEEITMQEFKGNSNA
ncbi:sugar transferase [Flavobacteriaceae bacterium]|nr:sugar transferase [Flavobacteriaceae bacterium]